MFERLKNIWELGRYRPEHPTLKETLEGNDKISLTEAVKAPAIKRMATIVEDDPIDFFTEESHD